MNNKKNKHEISENNNTQVNSAPNPTDKIESLYKNSFQVIEKPARRSVVPLLLILVIFIFIISFIVQLTMTSGAVSNWGFLKDLKILNLGDTQIFKQVEQNYIRENDYLATMNERLSPLVMKIFIAHDKKSDDPKEQIYLNAKKLAVATILTADGWLVTAGDFDSEKNSYIAVSANGQVFKVIKVITDQASGTTFMKLEADNLPAVTLGDSYGLNEGEKLITLNQARSLEPLTLIAKHSALIEDNSDLYTSSEKYYKFFVVNKVAAAVSSGAPVFNTNGEMIGLISPKKDSDFSLVVPSEHFKKVISQVLSGEALARPYLGVTYLDLHYFNAGLDLALSKGRKDGALLLNKKGETAVVSGSPADKAGLKSGDIIIKIEAEAVNGRHNLTELIQEYKSGQKIKVTVLRDTEEKEFEVELGSK